jgi:hypothetical protein
LTNAILPEALQWPLANPQAGKPLCGIGGLGFSWWNRGHENVEFIVKLTEYVRSSKSLIETRCRHPGCGALNQTQKQPPIISQFDG